MTATNVNDWQTNMQDAAQKLDQLLNVGLPLVDAGGTNKAAIDASGNLQVKGGFTELAGLSASALNADLVPSTDVSAYKWVSLQIGPSAFTGTLSFQGSNDNVNWTSVELFLGNSLNNSATAVSNNTNNIWHGPVYYRYFRARVTSYTSGTQTGTVECYTSPNWYVQNSFSATQSGTWNTGSVTTQVIGSTQTLVGNGQTVDQNMSSISELSIDITTTAQQGTSPTIQFFWDRKGADGNYYNIWQSAILTAAANVVSSSIGPGLATNQALAQFGRMRWIVGGTGTPLWTFSMNVYGK